MLISIFYILIWNLISRTTKPIYTILLLSITLVELSFSNYYSKLWVLFNENWLRKLILILNLFILLSMLRVSYAQILEFSGKLLTFLIFLLRVIITLFFLRSSALLIYTTFEVSLIPIFIIIIGWGYQIERLNARLRIMFYTLTASLPLLAGLVYVSKIFYHSRVLLSYNRVILNNIILIFFIIAFLVKTPIFLVHMWLPKAHVEAPVYGSMILAALLLKLGTYGVYLFFLINYLNSLLLLIFSVCFVSCFLVRLACIRILDIKVIIAYSSVAHIALVIFLFYLINRIRDFRAAGIILTHGLTSAPLFYLAYLQYERSHRRSLILNKSVVYNLPSLALFWFLILMLNIAAPPSLNLLIELIIVINLINQFKYLIIGMIICVMTRTAYSLVIYSSINQTQNCSRISNSNLTLKEIVNLRVYLPLGFITILISSYLL